MYDLPLLVFNHGFKFHDSVGNGCHVFTMLSVNISNIAIITNKNVGHCCIIYQSINLLENSALENGGYI